MVISSVACGAAEDHRGRITTLYNEILAYQIAASSSASEKTWAEKSLPNMIGAGGEWYLLALNRGQIADFTACRNVLGEKLNASGAKVTQQKYALAWLATGGDGDKATAVLNDSIGKQGLMSWVYALHLMNNGISTREYTTEQVIAYLLEKQYADGGWALMGVSSDTDVTAMTVQALAPYYQSNNIVHEAIDKALDRLSNLQDADGGYRGFGKPNPESAAQVWIALSSLRIDALKDDRFIKNGKTLLDALVTYRLEDGSYGHTDQGKSNTMATAQAFMAYAAYLEMLDGGDGIYLIQSPETSEPFLSGYKQIGTFIVCILALIVFAALLLLKKKSVKNYAAVVIMAVLLMVVICTVDIQKPETYYTSAPVSKENRIGSVTLEIMCDTVAQSGQKHIPTNGVILKKTSFDIGENETVYDVLLQAAKAYSIPIQTTGARGMIYLSGIANVSEYDFGDLSGWIYFVNGESYSESCDGYVVSNGDEILWRYTCELGNDLK